MKKNTNIHRLILLVISSLLTLFLNGCSTELYENSIEHNDKLSIREVSLMELSKIENAELFKTVAKIKVSSENIHEKMVYDSINKIYFDDENGKEITAPNGLKSYTFPMYAEANDGKVENIAFFENTMHQYEAYKVKYDFTEEQLKSLSAQELQLFPVIYTNLTTKMEEPLCWFTLEWHPYSSVNGDLTGNFANMGNWVITFMLCATNPPSSGTSQGGAGSTGNNTNPPNTTGGNPGYTTPIVLDDEEAAWVKYRDFTETLSDEIQDWLILTNNSSISNEAFNFLTINGYSGSNMSMIRNSLVRIKQNQLLFISLKPFIIEKQIDDTLLDPCSKNAFQQIKNTTNCDFAKVLAKLGADNSIYKTTLKTAHNSVVINGQLIQVTDPANTVRTTQGVKYDYTMYVNPDYPGKTKLYIASFLLHEIAHAYFFSLVDDFNTGATNSFNELPILYNAAVVNQFPINSDLHHQEIANSYVAAIAEALQEYQPGLPLQVYNDLAWSGLEKTAIFNTLYPDGTAARLRILNRKRAEQVGTTIDSGTPNEQVPMGQPCN